MKDSEENAPASKRARSSKRGRSTVIGPSKRARPSKSARPIKSARSGNRAEDLEVKTWIGGFRSGVHKGSPPVQILRNLDTWGWNRLVPMGRPDNEIMLFYWKYLEVYHNRNTDKISTNGSGCQNDLAAMIKFMNEKLIGTWKIRPKHLRLASTLLQSRMIQERASQLNSTNVEYLDVAVAALLCIRNEAGLMCEMLSLGAAPSDVNRSDMIRMFALHLINYRTCGSVTATAVAGAMLGMAKEAELMSEWMSKEKRRIVSGDALVPRDILECHVIREATFHLMVTIVQHYVPSAPIATPVIWDAAAIPEAAKSSCTDKLSCEDHQENKQDEKGNTQKRKKSEISIEVAVPTEGEGVVINNLDEADRIVDDDREWVEFWSIDYHLNDHRSPPLQLVKHEDILRKTWGWERLLPLPSLVEMPCYWDYLVKYYQKNAPKQDSLSKLGAEQIATNGSGCGIYLSAATNCCIKKEDQLMSALNTESEHMASTIVLSHMIKERAHLLISREGELSEVAMAAIVCIGNEGELMYQMLELNAGPDDIQLSDLIRMCALCLMNYRGQRSTAAAGAMMGIAYEAQLMCDWLRKDNELIAYHDPSLPRFYFWGKFIRERAVNLMFNLVEDSSCSANLPVLPYTANSAAEEPKSVSVEPDKLKWEGHKTEKTKRNRKNHQKKIPK